MTIRGKTMEPRLGWLRGSGAMLLLAGLTACGSAEAGGTDEADTGEAFVRVVNVEVLAVAPETFVEEIRLTGTVEANRDILISAEESGVIREVFVQRGARVAAGDPIAKIDDRVLAPQVDQARALAELAAQTWQRRQRLWEGDRIGSEIAYLEARYASEQAAANLRMLEERLDRTTIRAPFAGIVDERGIEVGSMVAPGQTVARLVELDPVKVLAGVPERYAPDVAVGAQANVAFDVLDGRVFRAPIRYVGATVDRQNRTFSIEVVLRNPDGRIKPEMVANMSVARREVAEALVVPQDAVVRVEGGYVVFVAVGEGEQRVAEERTVELGPARRNQVVIRSGVQAGEQVIVVGQKTVADGDRLRVVAEWQ